MKIRDWNKEQPHDSSTGIIRSRAYSEKNPTKVVWVKVS